MGDTGLSRQSPGADKKKAIRIAVGAGLLAIAIPIVFSIYWAWKLNLTNQIEFTTSVAKEVLRKSSEGIQQMDRITASMVRSGMADPCSAESQRLMGTLNLQADQIQAVGYVKDNTLHCTAYGEHHIFLGAPTFITPLGSKVWSAHELPMLPGSSFLIVAPRARGYAVVILPKTFLDVFADNEHMSLGLYSLSAKRVIVSRGVFKPEWLDRLGDAQQVQFVDDDHFVVLRRSGKFEFASFVAEPVIQVNEGLYRMAAILVPFGVIAGTLLALAVMHLARQQLSLAGALKVAIKRKEFVLHYQPIVDLQTGQWVGAEALIRWQRPMGETVPPDVFIKAAEKAGLIREITAQVIEMVGHDAQDFFARHPHFHIAINLSTDDLESRATIQQLAQLCQQLGASRGNLMVEATERGLMKADIVKDILTEIRSMDIYIAIDDFGTGYSSLSYLETFELDYLKIDKSFVDTMGSDSASSQVAPHIIEMAKSLNLTMIAEGVETPAQAAYLRARGVQLAQGWLFAKPMPFAQLLEGLSAQART